MDGGLNGRWVVERDQCDIRQADGISGGDAEIRQEWCSVGG